MQDDEQKRDKCIFISQVFKKKPADYQGPYCHPDMHPKNYGVADKLHVTFDFLGQLMNGNPQALGELEDRLRSRGLSGTFIIQYNRGGPGRPPTWGDDEKSSAWYARAKKSGAREIARITVGSGDEDEEYTIQL